MRTERIAAALLSGVGLAVLAAPVTAQSIVVKGGVVHTMAGPSIENGVVLIEDGKIAAVGTADQVHIPGGVEILEVDVVTPGLIDAHTVVGLAGYLNSPHDQDQLESSAAMQPELRAIDAYNARERLVEWIRGFGVTTIHTGHGPGTLISGETMIAKTRGRTVEEAVVVPRAMVAATLGQGAVRDGGKSPGNRSKAIAMLRAELLGAKAYVEKRAEDDGDGGSRDLKKEALARVLEGEVPLLVTVNRHQDIASALRVQREFGFRLVLDGAAEAYLVRDEIREAGVPVIVHPTMARAARERENLSMETAAILSEAGIQIALQSGFESYVPKTRVVLFEAAVAAAQGLGFERALAATTVDAARLLGISERVGSIEVGKDGDLALYDGDPFEYTTHCVGAIIEGRRFDGETH